MNECLLVWAAAAEASQDTASSHNAVGFCSCLPPFQGRVQGSQKGIDGRCSHKCRWAAKHLNFDHVTVWGAAVAIISGTSNKFMYSALS